MKKLSLLLVLVLVFSCFVACGGETTTDSSTPTPIPTPEITPYPNSTKYTYEGINFFFPEGYTKQETGSTVLVCNPEYPTYGDNITLTKTGKDSINNQLESVYESQYEKTFSSFSGFSTFEKTKLKGVDTLVLKYSFAYNSISMKQTQYVIFLDDASVIVTLTDVSGNYNQEFEHIINTVTFN